MSRGATPTVLLVEDNADDVILTRRAFRKAALVATLEVVVDGDQAVEYLERRDSLADGEPATAPALVLLDWKLPRRSGLEVLQWIRARRRFATLPVVVMTSSRQPEDIDDAYRAGANSYVEKPVAFDDLLTLVDRLHLYWLRTNVAAPSGPAAP